VGVADRRWFRSCGGEEGGAPPDNGKHEYDVAADGRRFLVNITTDEGTASPITVVLNWPAGLKK
jgi:hypothetical protein